jgi:hypothetical protein
MMAIDACNNNDNQNNHNKDNKISIVVVGENVREPIIVTIGPELLLIHSFLMRVK